MAMAAEDEYYVSTGEGTSQSRAEAWRIGFGLQAADGLTPSDYAVSQAREQIDGRVSYAEVEHNLREYHEGNKSEEPHFEADIVSTRISAILQDDSFVLIPPDAQANPSSSVPRCVPQRLGRCVEDSQHFKAGNLRSAETPYRMHRIIWSVRHWTTISRRNESAGIISRCVPGATSRPACSASSRESGRFTRSAKATPVPLRCSRSCICGAWASRWTTRHSHRTHSISGTRLSWTTPLTPT